MTREHVINMIDCILGDNILCDCIEDSTIGCNECRREAADIAINALQEQKTGKWIHREDMDFIDQNNVQHIHFMCKNCGLIHDFLDGHTGQYKYCPNCGAKMEGEQDDKRRSNQRNRTHEEAWMVQDRST